MKTCAPFVVRLHQFIHFGYCILGIFTMLFSVAIAGRLDRTLKLKVLKVDGGSGAGNGHSLARKEQSTQTAFPFLRSPLPAPLRTSDCVVGERASALRVRAPDNLASKTGSVRSHRNMPYFVAENEAVYRPSLKNISDRRFGIPSIKDSFK